MALTEKIRIYIMETYGLEPWELNTDEWIEVVSNFKD